MKSELQDIKHDENFDENLLGGQQNISELSGSIDAKPGEVTVADLPDFGNGFQNDYEAGIHLDAARTLANLQTETFDHHSPLLAGFSSNDEDNHTQNSESFENQKISINEEASNIKSGSSILDQFSEIDDEHPDSPYATSESKNEPPAFGADVPDLQGGFDNLDVDDLITRIQAMTSEKEYQILKEAILSGLHKHKALELAELHNEKPLDHQALRKAAEELINSPLTPTKIVYEALQTASSLKLANNGAAMHVERLQNQEKIRNDSMVQPSASEDGRVHAVTGFSAADIGLSKNESSDGKAAGEVNMMGKAGSVAKEFAAEGTNTITSLGLVLAGTLVGTVTGVVSGALNALKGKKPFSSKNGLGPHQKLEVANADSATLMSEKKLTFENAAGAVAELLKDFDKAGKVDQAKLEESMQDLSDASEVLMGAAQTEEQGFETHSSIAKRLKEIRDQVTNSTLPGEVKENLVNGAYGFLDMIQEKVDRMYQAVKQKFFEMIGADVEQTQSQGLSL